MGRKQFVDFAKHAVTGVVNVTVPDTDTCTKGHTMCNSVMQLFIPRNFLIYIGIPTRAVNSKN